MREAHIFALFFRFGGSRPPSLGRILPALLIGAVLVGGCATVPDDPLERAEFEERNDPMEPLNRQIFEFNQAADAVLLEPVAKTSRFRKFCAVRSPAFCVIWANP